ncbi:NADAR family protein [Xanthomonas rydalmerensis]|uniref:NADAR family protein n=1 Tax=Xanthomonas rydalmerensis TaxID=3046274 RepID=A0ABZ0JMQ8_9XANT|nr:NADAR family protein [Xanthomonas sp. DM-2023]WOS41091.1 NADAR family protein [Xanthomonas sp. DM-2023]WOS45276.1 NADAR family protein [Xanthomonas sp. DM-2023]WOS49455.1 NADAR family protein [Xanthomonas sp. DM-2023]WOS53635.1 NADAR family protein [Xanthomonas sp. DM-2023]WOS57818.1 NADAR family protein [Xanthomonas sp. DM-2023]
MHNVLTVEALCARQQAGEHLTFVYFWGHTPKQAGAIDSSCFSQWFEAPFVLDSVSYPTAEHYMMAGKARLFGDHAACARILAASHPKEAKAIGREIHGFDEPTWRDARMQLVIEGNLGKFGQHAALKAFLFGTGDHVLVEASPVDRIWGIGLAADDPRAADPRTWQGENLLGFALMQVRQQLAESGHH